MNSHNEVTDFPGNKFNSLARNVLAEYVLNNPHTKFIRHNDNLTYKVSTHSDTFLLRIHVPVTSAMGTHGSDFNMVNSEVIWQSALNSETNLILQKPVRNQLGSLVTRVMDGGNTFNCSLLTWVDGETYHRDLESEQTAIQIGEILATLHNHAS